MSKKRKDNAEKKRERGAIEFPNGSFTINDEELLEFAIKEHK